MKKLLAGCTLAMMAFAPSAFAADSPTVGLVLLHQDIYMSGVVSGVKAQAPDAQVLVENYAGDAGKEARAMENLTARGVDVIITSPLDAQGSVPAIRRAAEAGIPIICFNSCINDEDMKKYVKAFVLSDQGGLGRETGSFAANYLKEKGIDDFKIGVLQCDSFSICRERREGFFGELDKAGITYEIVADQEAYDPDKSVPAAENMLTANPDIKVLWSENDGGTVGLVRGVASAGLEDQISIFGTDISPQLAQYILDGKLLATTGQDGDATGMAAMKLADTILNGGDVGDIIHVVPVKPFTIADKATVQSYIDNAQ